MPGRMLWIDTAFVQAVASAGTAAVSMTQQFSDAESRLVQMTLMRTIIGMDVGATVHDSGEGSTRFDFGIGVVSQAAFAVPTLPSPAIVTEFPIRGWVIRERHRLFAFAADDPTIFTRRIERDLRSRRKLENGEMFIRFDNTAQEGTSVAITVTGLVRQLWLVS